MNSYELSLRQEVLLEKGADILGAISRIGRKNNISPENKSDPINVMYALVWNIKRGVLGAKTDSELDRIESLFDCASCFSSAIED